MSSDGGYTWFKVNISFLLKPLAFYVHVIDCFLLINSMHLAHLNGFKSFQSLSGPHHYQIADHGGLLVAVPANTDTPKVVKFSTDEGRCWHQYTFTDEDIVFTGIQYLYSFNTGITDFSIVTRHVL